MLGLGDSGVGGVEERLSGRFRIVGGDEGLAKGRVGGLYMWKGFRFGYVKPKGEDREPTPGYIDIIGVFRQG